jgi:2-dehydro-3-deoxyphosphogluconate aldolase / (4S)-4-hydroxy-2-oxoglutarate aldolase
MTILSQLLQYKIVAIVRGAQPADVLPIAQALYEGGVKAIEITLNSTSALEVIKDISDQLKDKMLVGAGTVLDASSAKKAIKTGAQFIISPSTDIETIAVTKKKGAVSIPGAFTPTEIVTAYQAGADLIKVFPSTSPQYIKELKAPLSHIPMMPTGGINLANIQEYKKAGAIAFGIGTSLVDTKQAITKEYLAQLTSNAKQFIEAVK